MDPDPTTIDPDPVPAGGQPSYVLSSDSEEETTDSQSPLPIDKNKQQVSLDNRGSTWKMVIAIGMSMIYFHYILYWDIVLSSQVSTWHLLLFVGVVT